jgi:hypothetical protein
MHAKERSHMGSPPVALEHILPVPDTSSQQLKLRCKQDTASVGLVQLMQATLLPLVDLPASCPPKRTKGLHDR